MQMVYDVYDFMVGTEQLKVDEQPPEHLPALYDKLIQEEYHEFMTAPSEADKLKEAMDLIWVLIGYCISKQWSIHGGWDAVARTNMQKIQHDPETGSIKRRADGKILKPADWKSPDLTPFVIRGK